MANLGRSLNSAVAGQLKPYPASVKAYSKPGGGQWAPLDTIRLLDLSKTLTEIAEKGPDVFYKGWIADSMAADMARNGGLITKADLAQYQAKVRVPVKATYKGYDLAMMPPPSGGGVIIAEALNILENYNLKAMGQTSPAAIHLEIEALQHGFLDRARYLGDPDFNPDMPLAKLTSKAYGKELAKGIDPNKHANSAELGKDILVVPEKKESEETTHFSTIDKDGMAVAVTYTLEGGWGSKVVVPGAGFVLNNEMGDFNKVPGVGMKDNNSNIGTAANLIGPGKRMLSSMTPTIVSRNGKVVLITGSPGSKTIPSTVLGVLLSVMEYGLNGRAAVDAPRIDHEWMPDQATIEINANPRIDSTTLKALTAMGHLFRTGQGGIANSIWVDPTTGIAYGENDRRQAGSKASRP
jgi:gamma-glutamyltranspeptidase/glutathione hydrolase